MRRTFIVPLLALVFMLVATSGPAALAQQAHPTKAATPTEWGVWYRLAPDNDLVEVYNWTLSDSGAYWSTVNHPTNNRLLVYGAIPQTAHTVRMRAAIWTNDLSCENAIRISIWGTGSPWVKYVRGCDDLQAGWNYLEFQLGDTVLGRGEGWLEIEAEPGVTGATWAAAWALVDGDVRNFLPAIEIGAQAR